MASVIFYQSIAIIGIFLSKKVDKGRECLRLILDVNISKNEKLSLNNLFSTNSPEDHKIRSDPSEPIDFVKIFKHIIF